MEVSLLNVQYSVALQIIYIEEVGQVYTNNIAMDPTTNLPSLNTQYVPRGITVD